MKRISYRIANFILIAALLLSGAVTAHAASTTEASEKVQLRSDCTLNSYILADGIAADQTAKTDARGKVVFDNLTAGIYLVSSVRTEQDGKYYVFEYPQDIRVACRLSANLHRLPCGGVSNGVNAVVPIS